MMPYITLIAVSFIVSLVSVPIVRKLAIAWSILDNPGEIKTHKTPTPYFGGIGIWLGFLASSLVGFYALPKSSSFGQILLIVILGSFLFLLMGFFDDLGYIHKVYPKLFFEFIVIVILFTFGIKINFFHNLLDFIPTYLWFVFVTHAFNNIDGLDGLSAGIAVIISIFYFLALGNNFAVLVISSGIIGSCLAYLIFNFPPARIFMGDTGSLFLGFALSALPLLGYTLPVSKFGIILATLFVFGYIIFDTTFVIFKRLQNKKSIFTGDLNHTYNLIQNKTNNIKRTLVIVYGLSAVLVIVAFIVLKLSIF
ncbi:MAG: undecaprenyl/decaprenyl-phosphate alpha-N-acetylglucosaminyl 1-phosphate transferase [Parcubacteria group bacterium]|nr:undecaprenyl/decaprenyl-phosphate alpha-N-acetylglucosaminyl 1-phosphate transferase [Parcubacteria group bacterium]